MNDGTKIVGFSWIHKKIINVLASAVKFKRIPDVLLNEIVFLAAEFDVSKLMAPRRVLVVQRCIMRLTIILYYRFFVAPSIQLLKASVKLALRKSLVLGSNPIPQWQLDG